MLLKTSLLQSQNQRTTAIENLLQQLRNTVGYVSKQSEGISTIDVVDNILIDDLTSDVTELANKLSSLLHRDDIEAADIPAALKSLKVRFTSLEEIGFKTLMKIDQVDYLQSLVNNDNTQKLISDLQSHIVNFELKDLAPTLKELRSEENAVLEKLQSLQNDLSSDENKINDVITKIKQVENEHAEKLVNPGKFYPNW